MQSALKYNLGYTQKIFFLESKIELVVFAWLILEIISAEGKM